LRNFRNLAFLFRYFFLAFPLRNVFMLALMLLAGILDGISIVALLPLLELVVGSRSGGGTRIGEEIGNLFDWIGLAPSIELILVAIVVLLTVKSLLLLLSMWQVGYTSAEVARLLRLRLIRAVMASRWAYHTQARPGHLAAAMGEQPSRASVCYLTICQMLVNLVQTGIYLLLALLVSWWVTVIAIAVGGCSMFLLRVFIRLSHRAGKEQTKLMRNFMARLLDGLNGIKPLKAMAAEDRLSPLLEKNIERRARVQRVMILSREALLRLQEPIKILALAGGIYAMIVVGNAGFQTVMVLAFLFLRTLQRIDSLPASYQHALQSQPGFAFIMQVLHGAESQREENDGTRQPALQQRIQLQNVRFTHGVKPVLDNLSLDIEAGTFVAVIGASGVGKSTLADLIIGLHRPDAGKVLIDGVPLREVDLRAWRRLIGYVPQETFLFNDTIRTNVTLGDETIDQAAVRQALQEAEVLDYVDSLPEGLEMGVGEKGQKFSGGQRQRISLARALIRRPRLLILDEATTGLDPETEREILSTLKVLAGKVTILAISHQPALVEAADIVYKLQDGKLSLLRTTAEVAEGQARTLNL
jgi:ATP-binding cassette subfamily C protein